jgi:glucose-6-phosphate 1-dehydrogenase
VANARRQANTGAEADVLVIFGITGDLARMEAFRALYRLEQRDLLNYPVVGVAMDDWTIDHLIGRARESIVATGEPLDEDVFKEFASKLSYVRGDFTDAATYGRVAESISGAKLPVVQNHLLQVLSMVAMEPPSKGAPDIINDCKRAVLMVVADADPARYVRGQYVGYREVAGAARNSQTETHCALRLEIDNWRWSGVPFFIRAGKALPVRVTEVRVIFRRPPSLGFAPRGTSPPEPNQLVLRIGPKPGARLGLVAQQADAGGLRPVRLDVNFASMGGEAPTAYEVLMLAAMVGDSGHFAREDAVEETWRIVQPLLDSPPSVDAYSEGSWGPKAAEGLVRGYEGWHEPWVPALDEPGQPAG